MQESTDDGSWDRINVLWMRLRCRFEGVQSVFQDALGGGWAKIHARFQRRLGRLARYRQRPAMWRLLLDRTQRVLEELRNYALSLYRKYQHCAATFKRAMADLAQAIVRVREEVIRLPGVSVSPRTSRQLTGVA